MQLWRAKRGVKVLIITSFKSHEKSESKYEKTAGTNRDTFEYMRHKATKNGSTDNLLMCYFIGTRVQPPKPSAPEMPHAKFMSIDDEFMIFGSGNQDGQSWYHSAEANVLVDDPAETKRVRHLLMKEQESVKHCYNDRDGKVEEDVSSKWIA